MTISPALYSSRSEEWATPQEFFDKLNAEFHFDLDAAASSENAKCSNYIDKSGDALRCDWYVVSWDNLQHIHPNDEPSIFCNPPYGKEIGKWFAKAREAANKGATVVMLAHARTDTRWWHEHVQGIAHEVRFVKGRLRFVGPNGAKSSAPFPSAVIVYRGKVQS